MRELFLVRITDHQTDAPDQSDPRSLILGDTDGTHYVLPVTEELLSQLADGADGADETPTEETGEDTAEPDPAPAVSRSLPEPDPLYSAPLTLRPPEIQKRIRAGATVAELAGEMGVAESRVDPYAHPVLLERGRIADMAKQSHPVREDGPAKLTLWEVLAAAFGTRGHSLSDADWDAFKEPGGDWIVRVTWRAGLSENSAEWRLQGSASSSATTEALNAVAADLTDPNFVQPVRTLTSIGRGERYEENLRYGDEEPFDQEADDGPAEEPAGDVPAPEEEPHDVVEGAEVEESPSSKATPAKRRRKAVTPHWEDVLLGVRANTKRPRQ